LAVCLIFLVRKNIGAIDSALAVDDAHVISVSIVLILAT